MKESKKISKDKILRIYINSSKEYYYPGEKFEGSILLDVFGQTKCDKLQVIAKGKIIIKGIKTEIFEEDDDEGNNKKNEIKLEPGAKKKKKKKMKEVNIEDSDDEDYITPIGESRKIEETKEIFKYQKIIKISSEGILNQGRYTIPFEVELPENIPGSFLYIDNKTYVEIAYSFKVKLNKIMIKEIVPIVIRQRESTFNYQRNNEFQKSILGCCCDNNKAIIKANTPNKYYLSNDEVQLNINIDNKGNDIIGSPINVELYQRIILFPKDNLKKIKITNIVGQYNGKKPIRPHKNYHKDISFHLKKLDCPEEKLFETKAIKHYKHKDVISFLNSSVNSDLVICEYEAFAGVQYPNWNDEELGVFISVLIYPPKEGILSKTVRQIANNFNNSIINKKIFLSEAQNKEDSKKEKNDDEFKKKKFYKYNDERDKEFKEKTLMLTNEGDDDIIKEKKLKKNSGINNKDNELEINNIDKINTIKNNNGMNENNFAGNKGYTNNKFTDMDTINSLQIKKEFNGDFLKDDLDNEFLDKESFQ